MSISTVPAKIVMRGTSTLSLHDRFSQLPARAAPPPDVKPVIHQIPVIAQRSYAPTATTTKINQKLAKQMENRPTVMRALQRQSIGRVQQRLPATYRLGRVGSYPMKRMPMVYQRRGGRFNGVRARGYFRGEHQQFRTFPPRYRNFGTSLNYQNWRGGYRPYYRGVYRGGRFNGRGGRGGTFRSPLKVSKEELDKQIEEYMSKTAIKLDTDIDSYMTELNL